MTAADNASVLIRAGIEVYLVFKSVQTCLAVAAIGLGSAGAAHARGESPDLARATFTVIKDCWVSGATVDLGTYFSTDTVEDVANNLGYQREEDATVIRGAQPPGAITYGAVSCHAGTPYTLRITGIEPSAGDMRIDLEKGSMYLRLLVKKVGATVVPDANPSFNGFGQSANPNLTDGKGVGVIGEGRAQPILGNVIPVLFQSTSDPRYLRADERLGKIGVYSAKFLNTINF